MIEGMHEHARAMLIGDEKSQLIPFFHIQFKDRPDTVLATPWRADGEKRLAVGALRAALKRFKPSVVNYAMISEAWFAEYNHMPRQGMRMPSEREDRKEVVIVVAGDHKSAKVKVWEIVRDDKGRPTDLVEDKKLPRHFEGQMVNLLVDDDE